MTSQTSGMPGWTGKGGHGWEDRGRRTKPDEGKVLALGDLDPLHGAVLLKGLLQGLLVSAAYNEARVLVHRPGRPHEEGVGFRQHPAALIRAGSFVPPGTPPTAPDPPTCLASWRANGLSRDSQGREGGDRGENRGAWRGRGGRPAASAAGGAASYRAARTAEAPTCSARCPSRRRPCPPPFPSNCPQRPRPLTGVTPRSLPPADRKFQSETVSD